MITIRISRTEQNPNYLEEKDRPRYYPDQTYPSKFIEKDTLIVEISEEQFKAIRKAVLEVF